MDGSNSGNLKMLLPPSEVKAKAKRKTGTEQAKEGRQKIHCACAKLNQPNLIPQSWGKRTRPASTRSIRHWEQPNERKKILGRDDETYPGRKKI